MSILRNLTRLTKHCLGLFLCWNGEPMCSGAKPTYSLCPVANVFWEISAHKLSFSLFLFIVADASAENPACPSLLPSILCENQCYNTVQGSVQAPIWVIIGYNSFLLSQIKEQTCVVLFICLFLFLLLVVFLVLAFILSHVFPCIYRHTVIQFSETLSQHLGAGFWFYTE